MKKKEAILSSALKLLAEKGVHDTPMSAISKAAKTGMGTIYNYFPNKEILINEIYLSIKEKEKSVLPDFESDKPIRTQFENYFTSIIKLFRDNPLYFKFIEQLQASPILTEESKNKGFMSVNSIIELLEKGQQNRIIKKIEIEELILFIGGAVLSYLRWHASQPKDTTFDNQMQMVWDAIKE